MTEPRRARQAAQGAAGDDGLDESLDARLAAAFDALARAPAPAVSEAFLAAVADGAARAAAERGALAGGAPPRPTSPVRTPPARRRDAGLRATPRPRSGASVRRIGLAAAAALGFVAGGAGALDEIAPTTLNGLARGAAAADAPGEDLFGFADAWGVGSGDLL